MAKNHDNVSNPQGEGDETQKEGAKTPNSSTSDSSNQTLDLSTAHSDKQLELQVIENNLHAKENELNQLQKALDERKAELESLAASLALKEAELESLAGTLVNTGNNFKKPAEPSLEETGVFAVKDGEEMWFPKPAWENLGKNKNGWVRKVETPIEAQGD